VQLPQGAIVDLLRVYFYDNDPVHNAQAALYAYDGAGSGTMIASVASTGQPGQYSVSSGLFSHVVDNEARALSVSLNYGAATTSALRICGVRLRYHYSPLWAARLPLVER
jgi:hypothetical protein